MTGTPITPSAAGLVATLVITLAGCDWVDSTGRQSGDVDPTSAVLLDEVPIGGAVELLENARPRVSVARGGSDAPDTRWRWDEASLEEGVLPSCAALDGFDPERAAISLDDACASDVEDCRLSFGPVDGSAGDAADFDLVVPTLRASVGVRRALVVGREVAGEFVEDRRQEYDFCLIAVNEAPEPLSDSYTVVDGIPLDVDAADGVLANDGDDEDVTNEPLRVLPVLVREPTRAVAFELREDGSFRYEPGVQGIASTGLDSFEYQVSDGVHTGADGTVAPSASVSITLVPANLPPVQGAMLPDFAATVDEFFQASFPDYFEDPEGARLSYAFDDSTPLPVGGDLELSSNGVLAGTPGAEDEGTYALLLRVDDGVVDVEADVTLVIGPTLDAAPLYQAGSVFDQLVRVGRFIVPVEPVFEDPEGEPLTYRSAGAALPLGVVVNPASGVVGGRARLRGTFAGLVVEARDPGGNATESEPFDIIVR